MKYQQHNSSLLRQFHQGAALIALVLAGSSSAFAQKGPFSPTDWPSTVTANATVDYLLVGGGIGYNTPQGWQQTISFSGGGDQAFSSITLSGIAGDNSTSSFMNVADSNFATWANSSSVDILLLVYGNDKLYNANGSGKTFSVREGALGTEYAAPAGAVPPGANNGKWNWMLFTITNAINPTTGNRYLGNVPDPSKPGVQNGGVNGGTLRIEGLPGIIIGAVAIGTPGAFGTTNQVNVFAAPETCAPEPAVNLAFIDVNAGVTNHLQILNKQETPVSFQSDVGPAGDRRKAFQGINFYMNFAITGNYLGQPCNFPRPMKVCIEFYDDPALAGTTIGPYSYALDNQGGVGSYTGQMYQLTGSDKWLRVAFWIPSVSLAGIQTAPQTGGPWLTFSGDVSPFIDRIELGVVRAGTNALAGLDPDPTFYMDPMICTTNYGYYAELDLDKNIKNGLDIGSSGGDQQMKVEMAGPDNDKRNSIRPDGGNNNLQFQILNQAFGPVYQDNADVSIAMTYYDDPALAGATLRPQVYQSWINGVSQITFPVAPYDKRVTLEGTGVWREAYFELPNVNFNGVNQGPQSLVRYQTTPANPADPTTGYVHVSRVRYDVIRPCGPNLGINMFQPLSISKGATNVSVNWIGTATLQAAPTLTNSWTNVTSVTNVSKNSYVPSTNQAQMFRLQFPSLPAAQ